VHRAFYSTYDAEYILGVRNQNLVGSVLHPAGNIAELLVAEGLAYVSDATVIFVTGGTAKLRAAERAAKEKKLRLWKNYKGTAKKPETSFSGIVTRIVSGDTIHVLPKGSKTERKIRLASIRQPRTTSEIEAGYAVEAKEFLRKRLIGKTVCYVASKAAQY
jgi:staphylococcal nuclease domain-containing protein 1